MPDTNLSSGGFDWSLQHNYGSLDNALYGYEYTPFDSGVGDMGAPESQWVYGAMDYLNGTVPSTGADGEPLWTPIFTDDIYKTLEQQYGGKGFSYGKQEDGRWKRNSVFDQEGNVVWSTTPYYQTPTNVFKDFVLPAVTTIAGAGAFGGLGALGNAVKGGLAVNAIANGNELGGLASLAGLGGFSDLASGLSAANALKNKDVLGLVSQGANMTGLTDWFSSLMQPNSNGAWLGEGTTSGIDSWDGAGASYPSLDIGSYGNTDYQVPGFTASEGLMMGTSPVAASLPSEMAAFGNSAGMLSPELSGMGGEFNPATAYGFATPNFSGEAAMDNTGLPENLRRLLGKAFSKKGMGTIKGLAQLYTGYRGQRDNSRMLKGLTDLYSQNGAYAQQLRKQLSRQDAASGRRSQYGPREVELQAKLAQMTSGQIPAMNQMYQQQAMARNAMLQGGLGTLASLFGG